jgi:3-deoxy-D-manno-octulosonic-acid transferase
MFYLIRRRHQGREDMARFAERLGRPSLPRPAGRLIWAHAASVGEANAMLTLMKALRGHYADTHILLTTGTVASAQLLAGKLPDGILHQYVPVDRMAYIMPFLDHWKPDLALWIESELWPNLLAGLRRRNVPAALVNARMSEKSFRHWQMARGWAAEILSTFNLCLAQTVQDQARLEALGARRVLNVGNLKYVSEPLSCDVHELIRLRQQVAERPIWLLASSHPGEEALALEWHQRLMKIFPDLLTVIAPRHAARGHEIEALIQASGLSGARRSRNQDIAAGTAVYLADTMGEMGLFYRFSPLTVMGGSLTPVGGHNIIEPAQLGAAIVIGPYMFNFSEIAREFAAAGAARSVADTEDIPAVIEALLKDRAASQALGQAAKNLAQQKHHVLDEILQALDPLFTQREAA